MAFRCYIPQFSALVSVLGHLCSVYGAVASDNDDKDWTIGRYPQVGISLKESSMADYPPLDITDGPYVLAGWVSDVSRRRRLSNPLFFPGVIQALLFTSVALFFIFRKEFKLFSRLKSERKRRIDSEAKVQFFSESRTLMMTVYHSLVDVQNNQAITDAAIRGISSENLTDLFRDVIEPLTVVTEKLTKSSHSIMEVIQCLENASPPNQSFVTDLAVQTLQLELRNLETSFDLANELELASKNLQLFLKGASSSEAGPATQAAQVGSAGEKIAAGAPRNSVKGLQLDSSNVETTKDAEKFSNQGEKSGLLLNVERGFGFFSKGAHSVSVGEETKTAPELASARDVQPDFVAGGLTTNAVVAPQVHHDSSAEWNVSAGNTVTLGEGVASNEGIKQKPNLVINIVDSPLAEKAVTKPADSVAAHLPKLTASLTPWLESVCDLHKCLISIVPHAIEQAERLM
ncbi:hypothetical protein cyc_00321 [Cyclospora cayetanensis]|uniref:Transmembrane protein n=1 Tax=Cyclospora cayetanensis TaxID=88456 RepID=A0A1D3CTC7_9EIME|nr:hypothetical protein cyc_00321 [Cyclospora cayetanensis]